MRRDGGQEEDLRGLMLVLVFVRRNQLPLCPLNQQAQYKYVSDGGLAKASPIKQQLAAAFIYNKLKICGERRDDLQPQSRGRIGTEVRLGSRA